MINFGKGSTTEDEDTVDDILTKAMANLNKFAEPILKIAQAHPSKTVSTYDPAKGIELQQKMMEDVPSFGETLLGGLTGVASGIISGGNMTTDAENPGGTTTGKAIGAAVGGFLGAGAYSGGRKAGKTGQEALGSIMGFTQVYKQSQQQKMAEDAVGSAVQQLGELNNPGNDIEAAANASQKREEITATLAQNLVAAGMGPDKAVATAQNIAAINAGDKLAQDPGLQAQRAIAAYEASGKSPEDKAKLKGVLNGIIIGQGIKLGKMPANAAAMLFGSGGGSSGGGSAGMQIEQLDENGNVVGPPIAVGAGSAGGGVGSASPSSAASGTVADDGSGDIMDDGSGAVGGVDDGSGVLEGQTFTGGNANKAENSKGAVSSINNMLNKLGSVTEDGFWLPQGAIDGKQWEIHEKGIGVEGGGVSGAITGAAGGLGLGGLMGSETGPGALVTGAVGLVAGGIAGAAGHSLGKGTTVGIPENEQASYTEWRALSAALSQQVLQSFGGRMTPAMKDSLDQISSPYSTNEDRKVALEVLQKSIIDASKFMGTATAPKGGNLAKKKIPGLIMFN